MTAQGPTFRFAPSPTGELHLGHALSALVGWRWAERLNGRFLLRIEDIDQGRTREAHVQQILSDLAWLGLTWEEPVLRQSEHFAVYAEASAKLEAMGLLYPCFATRTEIASALAHAPNHPKDPDGVPLYPGLHKTLSSDEVARRISEQQPRALRIDMEAAVRKVRSITNSQPLSYKELAPDGSLTERRVDPSEWGDAVIVRKDTPTSYHLSVVVDDARQGITHVTRGKDLEAATSIHVLLQTLLGLPTPLYHHHDLIADPTGRKLSKSARDTSLKALRAAGKTRSDVLAMIDLEAA